MTSDIAARDVTTHQRLRITYAAGDEVKFISHQDEFRLWERALRRAGLPLLYKQGFNPQPHLQFAAPLSVGFTGVCEYVDVVLAPSVPLPQVIEAIGRGLPPGVRLLEAAEIDLKADALANTLIGADYRIILHTERDELDEAAIQASIASFLETTCVWRERERKGERYTYNLRPLVFELQYEGYVEPEQAHSIFLRVQQRAGATGRPDEVVAALGLDDFARTLRRERLYFSSVAVDEELFGRYPVVEQQAIAGPKPARTAARRGQEDAPARGAQGRTLGERAGDEFV